MKIAILSDIHGNIFALDAVLEKVLQAEVDRIIFLGDFTGYYYHSREVFDRLNELSATMILGNHEHIIIICKKHGEFSQIPAVHLRGNGCPFCINKTEGKLYEKLKNSHASPSHLGEGWLQSRRGEVIKIKLKSLE